MGTVTEIVHDYARLHNRPFGLTNFVDGLAAQGVKKAQITNALDVLTADGRLTCTENGKAKVWLAAQDDEAADPETLRREAAEVDQLALAVKSAKADISRVNAELRSLSSAATVEAMAAETAALTRESDALEARLVELRAGGGPPPLSPEALEKVEAEAMACFDAWASRRRIAKDALGALAETFEMKEKTLQEDAAFETDEEHGVSFQQAQQLVKDVKQAKAKLRNQSRAPPRPHGGAGPA